MTSHASPVRLAVVLAAVVGALIVGLAVWPPPGSPENGSIAYVGKGLRGDDRDLFLLDPSTGATRNLTKTPDTYEGSPAYSPDGSQVLFDRYTFAKISAGSEREIDHLVLMDLASGAQSEPDWCQSPTCAQDLAWSPDGTHVALVDYVGGHQVLRSIDVADGTGIDLCTESSAAVGWGTPSGPLTVAGWRSPTSCGPVRSDPHPSPAASGSHAATAPRCSA